MGVEPKNFVPGFVWDGYIETMPRERLEELQVKRIRETIEHAGSRVPFYRNLLQKHGMHPEDIRSPRDISKIPFTTKADLQESYPYKMFAVPLSEIVRLHSSSGTTGQPTVVGYTWRDLNNWRELIARLLAAGGVTHNDIVQIAFGYGMFTGGFGLHYGVERIGAAVVPVSSGKTERQIRIMKDFGTTALVCTPSYALYIAECLSDSHIDPRDLKLRVGLFGGEPWTESMRSEIESRLSISATDNYGLSEVMGPGVSMECGYKNGMHIAEDHFVAEIIDPDTGEVLPPGATGELVLTTLTREALPLLRYRTRDITRIIADRCPCGRTSHRMAKPEGRTDDMLIIRGVNVFPSQIESILMEMEETNPYYQLIVSRVGPLDALEIQVEVNEKFFSDEMRQMSDLAERIRQKVSSILCLSAKIKLVEPKSLARTEGKAKHVIDLRKTN